MKKNIIDFYDETLYTHILDNGLKIFMLPNTKVNDVFVTFTTKYGGCNFPFMKDGKWVNVPNGIAHFLEHKMFEQINRIDPFTFFSRTGTYSNASTNYHNTSYIFAGNNSIYENLRYLLDFVQDPYFTDENVEKEKGIIEEEIKMYDDIPDRLIYERCIYNLFVNHPIRYGVGGRVEDIKKITKEDLYNCYKVFYQPSNMFLTITGNIKPDEVLKIIEENQKGKEFKQIEIKCKKEKEPNKVYKEYEIIKQDISIPYISYGIKIPIKGLEHIDKKLRNMYLSLIFNVLFDSTSIFYEECQEEKIIDTRVVIETLDTEEHKIFMLIFKSSNYNDAIKKNR